MCINKFFSNEQDKKRFTFQVTVQPMAELLGSDNKMCLYFLTCEKKSDTLDGCCL